MSLFEIRDVQKGLFNITTFSSVCLATLDNKRPIIPTPVGHVTPSFSGQT